MAHFEFAIPGKLEELVDEGENYYVRNILVVRELPSKLKECRTLLNDEGPEFILTNFDVYFSILHHEKKIGDDVVRQSYRDLHKATTELIKNLAFILEDPSAINEELRGKYQNVIKMLLYIYIQTIIAIEFKNELAYKALNLAKKKNENIINVDKKEVLLAITNLLQLNIGLFWDPPVVEDNLVKLLAELCYVFLQNPIIKGEKDVKEGIFNVFGILMKSYHHTTTFVIKIVQMVKEFEHLVQCIPEGVKLLCSTYNCKGLVHALVPELTEWQTDEKCQDSQGSRYCAQLLTAMAVAMPGEMLPEVLYLNKYLAHESATLRNSILNVITEIILNVLTKPTLNEEEQEYHEGLLSILFEHMNDVSAHVRTKVFQHWGRLHQENAIPRHMVVEVLQEMVNNHLHDKATLVRKSVVNCVNVFLTHNTHSGELSLKKVKLELEKEEAILNEVKPKIDQAKAFERLEMEKGWADMFPIIKQTLLEGLKNKDKEEQEEENGMAEGNIQEVIQLYLSEGKFREAFKIWKSTVGDDLEEIEDPDTIEQKIEEFLSPFKTYCMESLKMFDLSNGFSRDDFVLTPDEYKKFKESEAKIECFNSALTFLQLMEKSVELVVELLDTTSLSDMQEAIAFLTSAYQFNIDNSSIGIKAMLKIMQRNEQDRKDAIIEAFKNIYLRTDTSNIQEHCTVIINRLIGLLKTIEVTYMGDLEAIICEWVKKGMLDNNIIDMLWSYFLQKVPVSDEDSLASVELLRIAALGRKTIITSNIQLVVSVACGNRGQMNMALLGSSCNLLAIAGMERISITSADPPFAIPWKDEMFTKLFKTLLENFFKPVEFYHEALAGALEFVYRICGKPDKFCEELIKNVYERLKQNEGEEHEVFVLVRLCQLLGLVAIKQLEYLDETVYKELKRRQETSKQKGKKKDPKRNRNQSAVTSILANSSLMEKSYTGEDSVLEGAQAQDEDAEFVINILERNTVTGPCLLGQLSYFIVDICRQPAIYKSEILQGAAVIALMRFMLVASEFCRQNIQLLFTIFERTQYVHIKISILVHMSDLLTRFPNIVEPWTPKIYERLKDPLPEIRKATFFTLSGLILRDMVRAHSFIHLMVNSLLDTDEELCRMGRTFFTTLGRKENNLYNVLPDVFSHLMECEDVTDANIKDIMKFLFELIDKTKHIENLVDRFCSRFEITDNLRCHRHLAYCLSLITYNEKGLRKLLDDFPVYKHVIHDPEIYSYFKDILKECSKQQPGKTDLTPVVTEIEKCLSALFAANGESAPSRPPEQSARSTKKRKGRKPQTKQRKQATGTDDDSDFE